MKGVNPADPLMTEPLGQQMAQAAGDAVVAKPAEQSSLIGTRAAELLLEAGVPPEVLQLVPGANEIIQLYRELWDGRWA